MPQFQVSPEQAPGVYRAGVGFFPVGAVIELPDAASTEDDCLSTKFIPLSEEARELLIKHQQKREKRAAEAKERKKNPEKFKAAAADLVKPVAKYAPPVKPAGASIAEIAVGKNTASVPAKSGPGGSASKPVRESDK